MDIQTKCMVCGDNLVTKKITPLLPEKRGTPYTIAILVKPCNRCIDKACDDLAKRLEVRHG